MGDADGRLAALLARAGVGINEVDPRTGLYVRANDTFCEMVGYRREELLSLSPVAITHPDDAEFFADKLARLRAGSSADCRFDKRFIRRDGAVVWAHVTVSRGDPTDEERPLLAVIEDFTALRHEATERRAEEAARRLQTSALQAAANGIVITDTDGKVQWVNDAFCRLTGYSADEVLGRNPSILKSGKQSEAVYRELWKTISAGQTWQGELINRRKDGTLYSEEMTITPVLDGRGAVSHFIAIKQDITARRRHEEALAETEERHRLALDASELGTWWHDIAHGQVHFDERARVHFGLDEPVVSIERMQSAIHPDDLPRVREIMDTSFAPGGPARAGLEHRVVLATGEERWLAVHVRVHYAGDGPARSPRISIGTTQDITAAMNAADALRASEDRYRSLVDNLDDVVFSVDVSGRLTFVSGAIARFGYDPREIIGRQMDHLVHPDDRAGVKRAFASRLAGVTTASLEHRWLDAAGKVHFLRASTRPLIVQGRVVGLTGLATDVTLLHDTEEQLRAAQRMEAIGRLAGGVAHDFNNILSVITSYTELAMMDLREGDPLRADLREVSDAAHRAAALTRQLLAFSRRQVLEPEQVNLGALVDGLSRMLQRLIGEDVVLDVPPCPDDLFVTRVDRGQIEQVLMNLAVNARDAMPDGGQLKIQVSNAQIDGSRAALLDVAPGEYVELAVTDSGTGMPPEVRARIFEPFFTTKAIGKGTGLGLAMVHGIVKQSRGGISVETAPGQGTSFHIFLPRHVAEGEAAALPSAPPPSRREAGGHESILVVDDEGALRNVVKRALSSAGYRVLVAANPGEALLLCKEHGSQLALVLTDVVMPGMSGCELAKRLAPLCPSAKVLYMSGYNDEMLEHHDVPEQHFLRKPFDRKTLTGKVRSVLDEGRG